MELNIELSDAVQIVATIIVAYEVYRVARETKIQRVQSSKLETLNALATYHEDVRKFMEWLRHGDNRVRLATPENLEPEDLIIITRYLTVCERLSVGVRQCVYNFDVVNRAVSKSLRNNYIELVPYIQVRREIAKSDRVYEQFEWLCFELEKTTLDKRLPNGWRISRAARDSL
ncbi:DUF4760 domain-containing protein [Pseudooceanicola sediminis]|uniref:DUF4760 domain-containing protein n=1 Tax=Pseudooceanicola sediminis TaxID=2211117 RepID=A0A399J8N0_9RHOB|nr:DUF4760 domain-containing protein [Pseudooceanicola sediminis]RII38996.1 DUF4760 domain-containing protein [Pseudooceanicola sediminis]